MNLQNTFMTRREMLLAMLAGVAATGCSGKGQQAASRPHMPAELILCGAEEVFILSLAQEGELTPRKVWSWRATDCPDIPESLKRSFRSTDDCKPVDRGQKVLISSSSGAVALVQRQGGRALFHAEVINAHSVEMLPGGRIAAGASVGDSPTANRIILFDISSRRELASDRMVSAHGLVWDEQRQVLWASGNSELRAYRLPSGSPATLKLDFQVRLPDSDAHDLAAIPGTSRLFISTGRRCWSFDRDSRQVTPHDVLGNTGNVKSYSVHPATGRIAYMQAEGKNWWAEHVHFFNPQGVLHLPGQRLYKARWVC
jgi:hypothetical protein